jgi:hypothetical protein
LGKEREVKASNDAAWAVKEIDDTLDRSETLLPTIASETDGEFAFSFNRDPQGEAKAIEAALLLEETVRRLAPSKSMYARRLEAVARQQIIGLPDHVAAKRALQYRAILRALRYDLKRGAIRTLEETVRADLFSDQLDIADYFLEEGFLPAAAVTAGVVLEEHLRKLAEKHEVPARSGKGTALSAEGLNQSFRGPVYDLGDQKLVTAWLDLRNAGAHPRSKTKLTADRVGSMVEGVREFIVRHPA